jgi:hypothetical protein
LGYDPFFAWSRDTLFVGITHRGALFQIEIKLVDDANRQRGSRDIAVAGDACADVIDALGLTISLVIDPSNVAGFTPPESAGSPSPPAPAPGPADEAPVDRTAPVAQPPPKERLQPVVAERSHSLSALAAVGILGSVGAAPAPAVGGTLSFGLRWRAISLHLEGRADAPATGASELRGVSASSWLVVGSIVPCVYFDVGFMGFGCAVASFGALGATSHGVPVTTDQYAPWLALGARAGAEFTLSAPLAVRFYGELLGTPTRYELRVDGEPALQFGAWSTALGSSLVWRIL